MDGLRARGMPPKLGIKKRKPRPAAVVDVANNAQKAAPFCVSKPAPSRGIRQPAAAVAAEEPAETLGHALAVGPTDTTHPTTQDAESAKRKGLRHFAVRVSRKVEEKGVTTYNEVADELVIEEKEIKQQEVEAGGKAGIALQKKLAKCGSLVDEKNIRRRVYDSLNVLMAMGIIAKEKKLISWRGLAMARHGGIRRDALELQAAIEDRRQALMLKRDMFYELEAQQSMLAALVRRNASQACTVVNQSSPIAGNIMSVPSDSQKHVADCRIPIPFIIVQTAADAHIELEMDQIREDVNFTFSSPFAVFDDREIMRRLSLYVANS
jgi:transcription factor Dp-1